MKILTSLTILFMLSTTCIYGQNEKINFPIDSFTHKITYTEVVILDSSTSKLELYSRVREWFAKTYNSAMNVIQMDDKENGKIIGKALMKVYFKTIFNSNYSGGNINYTISIYVKDGKYKYEITDFYHTGELAGNGDRIPDGGPCEDLLNRTKGFWGNSYKKTYFLFLTQMNEKIESLTTDLKLFMNTKSSLIKKSDW